MATAGPDRHGHVHHRPGHDDAERRDPRHRRRPRHHHLCGPVGGGAVFAGHGGADGRRGPCRRHHRIEAALHDRLGRVRSRDADGHLRPERDGPDLRLVVPRRSRCCGAHTHLDRDDLDQLPGHPQGGGLRDRRWLPGRRRGDRADRRWLPRHEPVVACRLRVRSGRRAHRHRAAALRRRSSATPRRPSRLGRPVALGERADLDRSRRPARRLLRMVERTASVRHRRA